MAVPADPNRTSEMGLFHYARSFWQSGIHLAGSRLKNVTHPDAPVVMLLCQSIELYLKAFLRLKGFSLEAVEKLRHRYKEIADEAVKNGLVLGKSDQEVICFLAESDAFIESRYLVTGFKKVLQPETISKTCSNLDNLVSKALREADHPVRQLLT